MDDRGILAPGQLWLSPDDVLGRVWGKLGYLGIVAIVLEDIPVLKYVLIGIMSLVVLTTSSKKL